MIISPKSSEGKKNDEIRANYGAENYVLPQEYSKFKVMFGLQKCEIVTLRNLDSINQLSMIPTRSQKMLEESLISDIVKDTPSLHVAEPKAEFKLAITDGNLKIHDNTKKLNSSFIYFRAN